MFKDISLHAIDPEIAAAIDAEGARQEDHIELITSENYCSPAVMAAQGSNLTNMLCIMGLTMRVWLIMTKWLA